MEFINNNEMSDEQLNNVAAGSTPAKIVPPPIVNPGVKRTIFNAAGNVVGYLKNDGKLYCWKCTHCGNPVHMGTLDWFFCDPCNDKWYSRSLVEWDGTEAQLIAAAG